jgi:uncharacterized membrane protein YkoI
MRSLLLAGLLGCILAGPAAAANEGARDYACLSSGDALEAVSTHQVVPPTRAIIQARAAAVHADVVRAVLCRHEDRLVYLVMALRDDGRLVRITVDAASGKVKSVY